MSKHISRRKFVKRAGALVLLGGSLGAILEGCASGASPSPTAAPAKPAGGAAPNPTAAAPAAAAGGKTIKIGVPTSISGPYAGYGQEVIHGAQYAVKEINDAGGLLGMQFELVSEDSEGKPDVALRKADKLVNQDGIKFLTGTITSAESLAIADAMPKWGAIYSISASKSPKLTGANCNPNVFRVYQNDDMDANSLAPLLAQRNDLKTWYLLCADYEWGRAVAESFTRAAKDAGGTIVGQDFPPLGNTDFSSYFTKIKAAKPDGVWIGFSGNDANTLMKQAKEFGLLDVVKTAGGSTLLADYSLRSVGEVAFGFEALVNYTYSLDNPVNKKFVEGFKGMFKLPPTDKEMFSYSATRLIIEGIKKAGSTDVEKVAAAMSDMEWDTPVQPKLKMRKYDHQALLPNYYGKAVKDASAPGGVAVQISASMEPDKIIMPTDKTGCKGL